MVAPAPTVDASVNLKQLATTTAHGPVVKFATGEAGGAMTIGLVLLFDVPWTSDVVVSVTLNTPEDVNVCCSTRPDPLEPSPKSQL